MEASGKFKGKDGEDGKSPTIDYDQLASFLSGKLPKQPTVDEIVSAVIAKLPPVEPCKCKPTTEPSTSQHVVIVADKGASYWQRLSGEVQRAQDVYKGIDVAAPPAKFTGQLPQAILYENSIPRVIGVGANQVSSVLSRIVRGDSL